MAYKIMIVVVAALTFGLIAAGDVFHWVPNLSPTIGLVPFVVPFLWFVSSLPMAVMGWTLPDPDPDPDSAPVA